MIREPNMKRLISKSCQTLSIGFGLAALRIDRASKGYQRGAIRPPRSLSYMFVWVHVRFVKHFSRICAKLPPLYEEIRRLTISLFGGSHEVLDGRIPLFESHVISACHGGVDAGADILGEPESRRPFKRHGIDGGGAISNVFLVEGMACARRARCGKKVHTPRRVKLSLFAEFSLNDISFWG